MPILIGNKRIRGRDDLSGSGALALGFVEGGTEWLNWAASSSPTSYQFPDESAMLGTVQQGLHNTSVAWLPRLSLFVSPAKLMIFKAIELKTLAKAEDGAKDPSTTLKVDKILAAHGLRTQADLAAVPLFFGDLGVGGAPLLQNPSLNAMLGLFDLIGLAEPKPGAPDIRRDAAAFALQQACTPEEFGDFYRAYVALAAKLQTPRRSTVQRAAEAAVHTLTPLLFGALDGPQVSSLAPPPDVAMALRNWLSAGRSLGFLRLSEGVCRIIDSTPFTNETGAAAQQVVDRYLTDARSFVASHDLATETLSQDGLFHVLVMQSSDLYAELLRDPTGLITLQQFRRQ